MTESSNKARDDVQNAVKDATGKINASASQASDQSQAFTKYATDAEADHSGSIQQGLNEDEGEYKAQMLPAVVQPQMTEMQKELKTATDQMREQQKVISSSEEFVKKVFSSHKIDLYFVGHEQSTRLVTVPATATNKNAVVAFVLSNSPIRETLQLQYRVFTQPPNSYFTIHNIVIFFWGEDMGRA